MEVSYISIEEFEFFNGVSVEEIDVEYIEI